MYEHRSQPLISTRHYYRRITRHVAMALLILSVSLLIGLLGYHFIGKVPWLDALHNASMILSGMGPVVTIDTNSGKLFSSFYALFSGIVFITNVGVILAPAIHRLLHRLHLEEND